MKSPLFLVMMAALAVLPLTARADLRINEVLVNPGGTSDDADDNNFEYIELISTSGGAESANGLTLVVIDTTGGNVGRINDAWSLSGLSTGSNGLLLIGNGYPAPGMPAHPGVPAETALGDPVAPSGLGNDDIGANDGFTLLLVTGFTGTIDQDLDPNDNGLFDTQPWSSVVDSVGFDDRAEPNGTYAAADLTQSTYDPDLLARKPGNLARNTASAWFGGEILGNDPLNTTIDPAKSPFGGVANAQATPGRPNEPAVLADLRINEVSINPPGADDVFEFIEIVSTSGTVESANRYTLLVINTDNASDPTCIAEHRSLGTVVEAWNLSEFSTGANGLLLIGDGYDLNNPWDGYADPGTAFGDPDGLGNNNIGNLIATKNGAVCETDRTNDGFTLLLVTDFSGALDDDLDADDDGTLDVMPWGELKDSVGFGKLSTGLDSNVTSTYAQADLSQPAPNLAGYQPDNLSRKLGDLAANASAAWYGGRYRSKNETSIAFGDRFFGGFRGQATPGRANLDAAPAIESLFLSEVNIDHPGDDGDDVTGAEFVEIINPAGTIAGLQGYSLLIVNTLTGNKGEVQQVFDLSNWSTGPNGLLVFGDDFDSRVIYPPGVIRENTHVEDEPQGLPREMKAGDLPNGPFALLLVTEFAGLPGDDLDTDDDGVIDDSLGFTIRDGLAIGGGLLNGGTISPIETTAFFPGNVSRRPGDIRKGTAAAWYGGVIAGTESSSIDYSQTEFFGAYRGGVTPGQPSHAAEPGIGTILINEANINPPGPDGNFEYVELISTAIGAQSTNGLHLLVIDSDGGADGLGNTGTITEAWDLDALATGGNGLLLLGDGYDLAPVGGPFSTVIDPLTATADPAGFGDEDLENNDGLVLMLVRGFSSRAGVDLDANDDGTFEVEPWTARIDSVGFGVRRYGAANVGQATYDPDNISRAGNADHLNGSAAGDWYGGSLAGLTGNSTSYDPLERFDATGLVGASGRATPGSHNLGGVLDDLVDADGDGAVKLVEEALHMDPMVADAELLPKTAIVEIGGDRYLGIAYSRLKGGSGTSGVDYLADGIRYTVEVSDDLVTWVSGGEVVEEASVMDDGNGVSETVMIRLEEVIDGAAPRFLRLRVTRP